MGQRCSDTRTITFEDVVVPKEVRFRLTSPTVVTPVIPGGNNKRTKDADRETCGFQ